MNLRIETLIVNRGALDYKAELFYLFAVEFDLPILTHRTHNVCAGASLILASAWPGTKLINMLLREDQE